MQRFYLLVLLILTIATHTFCTENDLAYQSQNTSSSLARELSNTFTNVAEKAIPAVVFIKVENAPEEFNGYGHTQENSRDPLDLFSEEFFNRFFGSSYNKQKAPPLQLSQGSGLLISGDGYIITNFHVVKDAKTITVFLQDKISRKFSATLVGGDPHTDVAVIKIEAPEGKNFPHLFFGNSDEVKVGEWAIAIGTPFQLEASMTVGVISAKGRQNLQITNLEDFIQTDAAINPGNSGGPLLNLDGDVIGINTAIVSRSGGYMGIGFAIPSAIAKAITKQIIESGEVTRGFLGVSLQPIDQNLSEAFQLNSTDGALVAEVIKGSPAEKVGLQSGDIIIEFDQTHIKTPAKLRNEILLLKPDTKITLTVNRDGKYLKIPIILGSYDKEKGSTSIVSSQLGITIENLSKDTIHTYHLSKEDTGVVITGVKPGSIGAKNSLRPGYLIMGVNHRKIQNVVEFNDEITKIGNAKRILLLVRHGDIMRFHSIKIE